MSDFFKTVVTISYPDKKESEEGRKESEERKSEKEKREGRKEEIKKDF